MHVKKARLVINPRAGANLAKISEVLAVLAAAGWSTEIGIKEYGGHTMELATEAAKDETDLIIAYGGDGTVNQVVNGAMSGKGRRSIVGVIPGGTANVWASEVGVPDDPVKAALTLINSDARSVDIGHIEVSGLTFPDPTESTQDTQKMPSPKKSSKKKGKPKSKARQSFLLMAGLGMDAAIMSGVSKPLKYRVGPVAVGLSALKKMPEQHPFPVEIRVADGANKGDVIWQGEASQLIIGNTRKYADVVQMTPNAFIDDGILDICVITAGDPVSTMQQVTSLLLRRKPDNTGTEYFHGSHFSITVPATIELQLDGSAVKLKDYLSKSERKALENAVDKEKVSVTYRFDAMARALQVAIPRKYDDELFEEDADKKEVHEQTHEQAEEEQKQSESDHQPEEDKAHHNGKGSGDAQDLPQLVNSLLENGRKVNVVGTGPDPDKKKTYILAGSSPNAQGDPKPVAVLIDAHTKILNRTTGQQEYPSLAQGLQDGKEIVVEGKKSKRGVIPAKRVVL